MTTMFLRGARNGLVLAIAGMLAACASTDRVYLTGSRRLNICSGDEPHPVGVRVYYLSGTERFMKADFASLWENDLETLQDDRIKVSDVTVVPQDQTEVVLDRPEGAKSLGIVANFCKPGEGCWRALIPLEDRKEKLRVHLDEGCLSLD
jgi:type VI secretion system VasD/TssJ family lipoprotein